MFNPYREWLGIPEDRQPPHFYQLLGIQPFETDADVISRAADRVMLYIRTFQTGPYSDVSQKLLNEIAKARVTLLSPESKEKYDSRLRHKLRNNAAGKVPVASNGSAIPVAPIPVAPIPVAPIPVAPIPVAPIPVAPIPVSPTIVSPISVSPIPQAVPLASAEPAPATSFSNNPDNKTKVPLDSRTAASNVTDSGKPFSLDTPDVSRQSGYRRTVNRGKSQKIDPTTLVVIFLMVLLGLLLVLWAVSQDGSGSRPSGASSSSTPEETLLQRLPPKSESAGTSMQIGQVNPTREVVSEPPDQVKPPQMVASDFNALIATAGQDGKVRLWIPRTGKQLRCMTSDQSGTSCVAFSPDGQMLLSGGSDCMVHLWKAMDGTLVQDFVGHTGKITDLAYSPTGKVILSASLDGNVCVWETDFGVLLKTFRDTGSPILSAVWSPDGRSIAAGDENGRITVWDAESGKIVAELSGHEEAAVQRLRYEGSGRRLASGSDDGRVCLWNTINGKRLGAVQPGIAPIEGLAFSHDGLKLAVCGKSELIQIYSCSGLGDPPILTFHTGRKEQTALDWSSDGRYILTSGSDGMVCIYDAANGDSLGKLQTKLGAINDAQFFNETLGAEF